MNKLLKWNLTLFLVILGIGSMRGNSFNQLLEEGRTWWYQYWYDEYSYNRYMNNINPATDDEWTRGIFGLTLCDPQSMEGKELYQCMVIDRDGNLLIDRPIALLYQEKDQVYVRPQETTKEEEEYIETLPGLFREVYYRFLEVSSYLSAMDDLKEEYLLYDWSMKPSDRLEYPWIYDLKEDMINNLEKVTITSSEIIDGYKTWYGTWGWNDHIKIIEGIGNVSGQLNTGTFLYPCSFRVITTGLDGSPDWVGLIKVTDKDGKIIYNPDPAGLHGITTEKNLDGAIYDLCGRRVANPQPGTVYIRDGRKYVAR